MIGLTVKETQKLRDLFWALQEAQGALKKALEEIAKAHGLDLDKGAWSASPDFKYMNKIK